jgi:predicted secreted protein
MAKFSANNLILKVESAPASGVYVTVGGFEEHTLTVNDEPVDTTDKDSARWRELNSFGLRSVDVSASGFLSDDANFELVYQAKISGDPMLNFRMEYGNSKTATGQFFIASAEGSGSKNESQKVSISLQSSGAVTFA